MDIRAPSAIVTVVTFPADDVVFAQRVGHWLDDVGRSRDDWDLAPDLEAALRGVHPHVVARWRERLAGFGSPVLYVFRDGSARDAINTGG